MLKFITVLGCVIILWGVTGILAAVLCIEITALDIVVIALGVIVIVLCCCNSLRYWNIDIKYCSNRLIALML